MTINILIPPKEIPTKLLFNIYDCFSESFGVEYSSRNGLLVAQKDLREEGRLVYAPRQDTTFIVSGGGPISVFRPETTKEQEKKTNDFEELIHELFAQKNHPYELIMDETLAYRQEEYSQSFWNSMEQEKKSRVFSRQLH